MKCFVAVAVLWLAITPLLSAGPAAGLEREVRLLDAVAADPDSKPVVVAAMAAQLNMHRNHLLFLRKETGRSLASILVAELRGRGLDDVEIVDRVRKLRADVRHQLDQDASMGVRPVVRLLTLGDHSSAADVLSLSPEIGVETENTAVVIGVPYLRVSSTNGEVHGPGDVYLGGFLRTPSRWLDFGSSLTLGAPTGDRSKGLGAGKVTVDVTETLSRRMASIKPWISGGFSNSISNNVGYVRPYTTDGNAVHLGAGIDVALSHRLAAGLSGFGLEPLGSQVIYSQVASGSGMTPPQAGGGMMPGGGMGAGMGPGGGTTMMPPVNAGPFYMAGQRTVVGAGDLRDYGASVWVTVPLYRGLWFDTVVSRSVPFHLTAIRVGVGADAARLLFPKKHF